MENKKYDSIVVGGGIAGLTSAVYLAREGQNVLLIEKNKECGGLVNTFSRDGFRFEAGVRALLNAGIIFPMLEDLGIEMEVVKSKVSLGVADEIIHIDDINSLEDYKHLLVKLYPKSEKDIDQILKVIRKIMKHMEVLYGVENPAFKDLKKDKQYIFKQLLPWLPKFIFTVGKINRMNMPVEEYLEDIVKDASLRDIIAQHFFKHTPTFFALSYFSLYLDYFYPKGGVGTLAELLYKKTLELGGEIKTETVVIKVDAKNNVVTDHNNIEYKYKNLVWAADLKTWYKSTLTDNLPSKIISDFENKKLEILKSRGTDSVFSLYLQVDEPLESFGKIAHGHFFYTPSKKGLGQTHRKELDDLLNNWSEIKKEQILQWLHKFTELNTYEISVPALKDPTLAPKGKSGVIISLLTEYDLFEKVADTGWYNEFKTELETQMIKVITNSIFPFLKEKIIKQFSFTPLGIKDRIGSSEGSIVGWSFEKPIPVVHKMQYSDKSTLTPIPNIYQAGQWAFSPAGVPMCILIGKLAVDKILKKKVS
jgi:phytoene dehydrogenase-like protein